MRFRRWRAHAALAVVALLGVVAAGVGGAGLLGTYAPALQEGALVSRAIVRSAVVHVNVVGVALGFVPLLVAGAWALTSLVRPPGVTRHAFAAVVATTVVFLALQTASVVERFGLGLEVKDRYLLYVAPLLFLATAAALDGPRPHVAALLGVTAAVVLTVGWERFEPVFGVNVDSPASSTHELLTRVATSLGLAAADLVAIAIGVVALAVLLAFRRTPTRPLAVGVLGTVLALVAAQSAYTWDRLLSSSGPAARPLTVATPPDLSWIDRAIRGGTVGMVPYSVGQEWYPSAVAWWDLEFWNKHVRRAYLVGDRFTYTPAPFPHPVLTIDPETGAISGAGELHYLARTELDARFRPAGAVAATAPEFELVDLEVPLRAAWVTHGLWDDGWTHPARAARIRVFPPAGATLVRARLSAPDVEEPRRFSFGGVGGTVESTDTRVVEVEVCVPASGYADVPIAVEGTSTVRDVPDSPPYAQSFRPVGLRLSHVEAVPTGRPCPP